MENAGYAAWFTIALRKAIATTHTMSLVTGFLLPFRGLGLVTKPGLRSYVIMPLLINLLVLSGIVYFGADFFEHLLASWLPDPEALATQQWPSWLGWLQDFAGQLLSLLRWLIYPVLVVALLMFGFYTFTIIANLIASPFNSMLAARVERELTGQDPPESNTSLAREIPIAIGGELNKLWYFIKRAIPILILFLIPGLQVIAAPLWLLLGIWFLALEYADYPMGNHQIKPADQRKLLAKQRLLALGFGGGVTVMLMIPVLNLAAMPAAVAGATCLWAERVMALRNQPPAEK